MEIFVYADETSDPLTGTGMLITQERIDDSIINKAMDNLKDDPEFNKKMDGRTISRRYFHASEDSKNAHSWLCRAICDNVIGEFNHSYLDNSKLPDHEKHSEIESLHRLTLSIAFVRIFNRIEKVNLIVEKRNKFGIEASEKWIEALYKQLEESSYNLPSLLTHFPEINIEIGDKLNPGLQVVDFILWAVNRNLFSKKKDKWVANLGLQYSSHYKDETQSQLGGDYYLKKAFRDTTRLNYPVPVTEPKDPDEFFDAYLTMEHTLKQLKDSEFPLHAKHLENEVSICADLLNIDDFELDRKGLERCSRIYLRVFDTLPIYEGVPDEDIDIWNKILRSKKMVGLFLNTHLINGNRSADSIIRTRRSLRVSNPEIFDPLN